MLCDMVSASVLTVGVLGTVELPAVRNRRQQWLRVGGGKAGAVAARSCFNNLLVAFQGPREPAFMGSPEGCVGCMGLGRLN